jgi:nucleotide-binding universal stress UspA family protein
MFRNILIATDGSALSEKLLGPGPALARALGAKITGLHVIPEHLPAFSGEMAWVNETLRARFRQGARETGNRYLDRVEAAARAAGVPFERVLAQNDHVWKGIIATAEARGCDLILMAAHGRRGLSGLLLGSETNRVLVHSRVPVLVYR